MPWRRGAIPDPTWCRSAASAWCTDPSSNRRKVTGPPPCRARRAHAVGSPIRHIRPWASRYYQQGELRRLLGDFAEAEEHYRRAGRNGRDPMPGLALLQLARGDGSTAVTTIKRALQERSNPAERTEVLSAAVEICRAVGDFTTARAAADELSALALRSASPFLQATAACANGSVLLGAGDVQAALAELRAAARAWQALRMPYDAAKTAVLLGLACAALGDCTSARLEFDSAAETFTRLGATPDVEHVRSLSLGLAQRRQGEPRTVLSAREREVLMHLVGGSHQPPDRRDAHGQPAYRRAPRRTHLRKARCHQPHRGDRVRVRAPSRLRHGSFDPCRTDGAFGRCGTGIDLRTVHGMSSVSYQHFTGTAAENYQRDFVPPSPHRSRGNCFGWPTCNRVNASSMSRVARG